MQNLLQGLNIYLVGMMGSGKTTVGELLAKEMGYKFFDTDSLITQIAGKSIPDIFAEDGEPAFRVLESQVLGEISSYTRLVVATGGGIVIDPQNWSYLHQGLVIWLDVPISILVARLQSDISTPYQGDIAKQRQGDRPAANQRPLLQDTNLITNQTPNLVTNQITNLEQRLQNIFIQRQEMYAEADLRIAISASQTPLVVKDQVLELIPTVLKKNRQLDAELN